MKTILKIISIIFLICSLFFIWIWWQIPSEKNIKGCLVTSMYQVNLCPGSKTYVPLKNISSYLKRSVILTEDGSFFQHNGFDWEAIESSAKANFKEGTYKKGGSTITQQLAKNMFLYKDKTLLRKFLEALIVIKIEKVLSKNEILERYLNVVEFGKNIYGVKQASSHYFKKHPSELNVLESAFLAMILPNPVKYSRSYYKKDLTPFARKRIAKIVKNLYRVGKINEAEYNTAILDLDYFLTGAARPIPEPTESDISTETDSSTIEDLENAETNNW